ncbi:ATP-binding protein [Fictibacillus terranigra]|uniref:ATP-binding protein n=1 Tax=Fictibacillus terranigra TaxID=3058424 RepID=A0ABT8E7Y0_9BACL|nr:ATP-binding protein [Fictibacillus sp. CENA-BCM004]MDN4074000.1 ATP-binding protein [Fictibacillus sp. CENA-BCM004]
MADRERIHQLIVILLDNAMKHTGQGNQILLAAKEAAVSIELMVRITDLESQKVKESESLTDSIRVIKQDLMKKGLDLVYL